MLSMGMVSTRSRPKAAGYGGRVEIGYGNVSTRSRPKAAGGYRRLVTTIYPVSTRSRPKAAGWKNRDNWDGGSRFNTQPPEGGWNWRLE